MVLLISLTGTFLAWRFTQATVNQQARARFNQQIVEIKALLRYRVDTYINTLYGFQSLFATDELITRNQWRVYCEKLNLQERYPGIHTLSYAERVQASEIETFVQKVRSDTTISASGYPEFRIFPDPNLNISPDPHQNEYYVINYIWPWEANKAAHGVDHYSDPIRRVVIEQMRDTGEPGATGRVTLTVDKGKSMLSFLVMLPIYRPGLPITTVSERRSAIQGYVVGAFRVNELLFHTLNDKAIDSDIDIEVFDGTALDENRLYYNGDKVVQALDSIYQPRYAVKSTIDIAGRTWTLYFSTRPEFGLGAAQEALPLLVLSGGLVFSVLLSGIVYSLATARSHAMRIAEEITRKLEEQRALTMHSDRLRSLGEMAAGIAHELNQPLVGVRGLAEHILIGMDRGWKTKEETLREKVSLIVEQADRMSHIIEHVRIFAREAGKPDLLPVQINDVVQSAVSLLGAQFHARGLVLEYELARNLPSVLANPFSLEEVVLNLLVNARDAMEERLQTEPSLRPPRILLRTLATHEQGRSYIKVEVTDKGIGISEDIQAKIFDPFFTTKGPDKGTGLGLSISKSIIEGFGGTLSIQSLLDQGTTAIISLPEAQYSFKQEKYDDTSTSYSSR